MASTPCNYVQFVFTPPLVIFLVFLLQLMPIEGEEINKAEFNFVAAGDWGCGHEAIHTFSMIKVWNQNCILDLEIILMRTL
jgi:hypothetical protein